MTTKLGIENASSLNGNLMRSSVQNQGEQLETSFHMVNEFVV